MRVEAERQNTDMLRKEVKRLIEKSRSQPTAAGAELGALGDEAIHILSRLAQAEGRRKRRMWGLFFGVASLGYAAGYIGIHIHSEALRIWANGISFIGGMGCISAPMVPARATMMLSKLDDTRTVEPLLDALSEHNVASDLYGTIRDSLERLLPRLRASDAEGLLPRHIAALNKESDYHRRWHANVGGTVSYELVVLKALEQVGNETSIPAVEKVLQTTKNPKVREAAEACLPYLKARAAAGKHTLLRAASEEDGELLRAAAGSEGQNATVLLRPTTVEND